MFYSIFLRFYAERVLIIIIKSTTYYRPQYTEYKNRREVNEQPRQLIACLAESKGWKEEMVEMAENNDVECRRFRYNTLTTLYTRYNCELAV